MPLPDPRRSRVVLIGTSEYSDDALPDLPSVKSTIDELALLLTNLEHELAPRGDRHCIQLMNEGDLRQVGLQLESAADEAEDLLLVYYVGHGLVAGTQHDLYLGLPDTRPNRPGFSSLRYEDLRDIVLDSKAVTKVVVLDCDFLGGDIDNLGIAGATVLASANYAAFSSRLLSIVREGIPDGPAFLSTDDIYRSLVVDMATDGLPRPRKYDINVAGAPLITKNHALPEAAILASAVSDHADIVSAPVLEVLRAAALLGETFSITDLATVLDRRVTTLVPAIDEATAIGVLTESGSDLRFRDTLIWKAAYNDMSTALRTAWHRDAGRALASSGAATDCVARQILCAIGAPSGVAGDMPLEDWMLDWLLHNGDALIGRAPKIAVDVLDRAATNVPFDSDGYAWLTSRLAFALFFTGDIEQAQQVAKLALERTTDPDLLVHVHSTMAQCLGITGSAADATATLDRVLDSSGLSARHRARLLVPAARTHFHLGAFTAATKVATDALEAASEAGDKWVMGWASNVIATAAHVQGRLAEALPLFDRALTVTQSEPTLVDLRLLIQINKAATLGNLGRYQEATKLATQACSLADQFGTAVRMAQARSELSALQYETGQWDDALAWVTNLAENPQEPAAACNDLGTAAIINFHRNDPEAARRSLASSKPYAKRLGQRFISQLALAQSMDRELAGDTEAALAILMDGLNGDTEEHGEIDFVLPDAVRLAVGVGDDKTARKLAEQAAALAERSEIPHRLGNDLYCQGLVEGDPEKLVSAAERYEEASRPLYKAMAYEAAADRYVLAEDEESRKRAREAMSRSVEAFESLGAVADVARIRAAFRPYGIRRGPHSKHRRAESGWESLTPMEEKVAAFVSEGLSNPEVAERLGLSRRTVGTHVSHILKKLHVTSRADVARESALRTVSDR